MSWRKAFHEILIASEELVENLEKDEPILTEPFRDLLEGTRSNLRNYHLKAAARYSDKAEN